MRYFAAGPVEVDGRNISGIICPWNVESREYGVNRYKHKDVFLRGSLRVQPTIPTPLYEAHDDSRFPVGASIDWEDRPEGMWMAFTIANTPRGNEALQLCKDGICRGFSVGVGALDEEYDDDTGVTTVLGGDLLHNSLTPQPKFPDAKVDRIFDMTDLGPAKRVFKIDGVIDGLTEERAAKITRAAAPPETDVLRRRVKRLEQARRLDRLEAWRR